jgi:hypothetical protein
MAIRHARSLSPLVLIALLLSFGCEESAGVQSSGVGPSSVYTSRLVSSQTLSIQPDIINAQFVPGAFCPTQPPFLAPVNLVFRAGTATDLLLNHVQMQFIDRAGTFASSMTFTRQDLLSRFGTVVVPAFGVRTFPFAFPFGCVGLSSGLLNVVVFVVDPFGREESTRIRVSIRGF